MGDNCSRQDESGLTSTECDPSLLAPTKAHHLHCPASLTESLESGLTSTECDPSLLAPKKAHDLDCAACAGASKAICGKSHNVFPLSEALQPTTVALSPGASFDLRAPGLDELSCTMRWHPCCSSVRPACILLNSSGEKVAELNGSGAAMLRKSGIRNSGRTHLKTSGSKQAETEEKESAGTTLDIDLGFVEPWVSAICFGIKRESVTNGSVYSKRSTEKPKRLEQFMLSAVLCDRSMNLQLCNVAWNGPLEEDKTVLVAMLRRFDGSYTSFWSFQAVVRPEEGLQSVKTLDQQLQMIQQQTVAWAPPWDRPPTFRVVQGYGDYHAPTKGKQPRHQLQDTHFRSDRRVQDFSMPNGAQDGPWHGEGRLEMRAQSVDVSSVGAQRLEMHGVSQHENSFQSGDHLSRPYQSLTAEDWVLLPEKQKSQKMVGLSKVESLRNGSPLGTSEEVLRACGTSEEVLRACAQMSATEDPVVLGDPSSKNHQQRSGHLKSGRSKNSEKLTSSDASDGVETQREKFETHSTQMERRPLQAEEQAHKAEVHSTRSTVETVGTQITTELNHVVQLKSSGASDTLDARPEALEARLKQLEHRAIEAERRAIKMELHFQEVKSKAKPLNLALSPRNFPKAESSPTSLMERLWRMVSPQPSQSAQSPAKTRAVTPGRNPVAQDDGNDMWDEEKDEPHSAAALAKHVSMTGRGPPGPRPDVASPVKPQSGAASAQHVSKIGKGSHPPGPRPVTSPVQPQSGTTQHVSKTTMASQPRGPPPDAASPLQLRPSSNTSQDRISKLSQHSTE